MGNIRLSGFVVVLLVFGFGCSGGEPQGAGQGKDKAQTQTEGQSFIMSYDTYKKRYKNKTLPTGTPLLVIKDGKLASVVVYPSEDENYKTASPDPGAKIYYHRTPLHKNRLEVMLKKLDYTEEFIFKLLPKYNAEIIGYMIPYDSFTIKLLTDTFEELDAILRELETEAIVMHVSFETFKGPVRKRFY